jgi:hypothetical protein
MKFVEWVIVAGMVGLVGVVGEIENIKEVGVDGMAVLVRYA